MSHLCKNPPVEIVCEIYQSNHRTEYIIQPTQILTMYALQLIIYSWSGYYGKCPANLLFTYTVLCTVLVQKPDKYRCFCYSLGFFS